MKKYVIILVWYCFFVLNFSTANAWECEITVNAPKTIKVDQEITLSASGTPIGGSYSWSRTPGLTPNGSTARLVGFQPTYSKYIKIVGYYTNPKGKKCFDKKWLWVCLCTLEQIAGPAKAKIGKNVTLTTKEDPEGGTYVWTIELGTGKLTPRGSSVIFVGDQQGTVEIKASYTPPDGGEPCTKYHTIEVEGECTVSLSADMLQRPVCRPVNFNAQAQPAQGDCTWSPASELTQNGCNATYNGTSAGLDTVTVTYAQPGGTTCEDSKSILSYELINNMTPKKKCYLSGTNLATDDFNITTSPPNYHSNALLSPVSVSTIYTSEDMLISASLSCDQNIDTVSTIISVVNENIKTGFGVNVEIPNLIKKPLEVLGLADRLEFKMVHSYEQGAKCCLEGARDSTSGKTFVDASVDLKNITIYGVPLPKAVKKYFALNALQADLKGETSITINGEYKACENIEVWSGGGEVEVKLNVGSEAKAVAPYVSVRGELKGGTNLSETLTVNTDHITAKGSWGGLTVSGKIEVQIGILNTKIFEITQPVIQGSSTPVFNIDLPSLK